jgi:class 3 adenylate cyclase/tetratricopeptide (TPR) repeat protein
MAVCRNCGKENPEGFRFCGFCSAALDEVPTPQAEERKVVSILFVDLVGFTARSHDADPEDVRAALGPYHQLLKREIERFGGTVEKFIGDAVMAVFGAPVGHEDDAERAVRAALRITEAIDEPNQSLALELSIRAAVNTGEGLVTIGARPQAGEAMVTGDVVNTASRLQGVAPVNGVAVGELTYRSTKDVIDYEQLEPVSLKGKPEPVPVWRAVSAKSRYGVDLDRTRSTPFIGRDFELDLLKGTFRRTLRESSIQLVTIVGEPGVGKSRLLSEFFSFVDDQEEIVYFRQGRCLPYGDGITFWALGEVVKAQAGILESDDPEEAADKLRVSLEAVIKQSSELDWFFARLAPLVGAATEGAASAEREESFTAWRRFLEAIAERSPLVLVFEDLHWADEALLEFIEHLVEWSTGVPLLVVCTARPELFDKHSGWGAGHRNTATVSLSPLNDSETAQLISGLLSQAVLPAEVHSTLLERAGGNPLYAEEFVRMLSDRGILRSKGRVLTIDGDADIPLPDSVQALVAARLDTLSSERKALLHDAAVAGKVFWSGAIAAIGELAAGVVTHGLHELARKELVRPARASSMEGEQEYSFWHALIRDVCYAQIPRAGRAARHKAMAQWLEGIAGERVADHAEVLAHHYTEALKLSGAAGQQQQATELEEPARRFLVLAGDRALHLDAAKAETYYRRALELLPGGHPDRGQVLLKGGEATEDLGLFSESERYLVEAISELRAHGDLLGAGYALAKLARVAWSLGDSARYRRLLTEAIQLLETRPPGRELCYAYTSYASSRYVAGVPTEALEWADKALSLANHLGDEENVIRALGVRGGSRGDLGDLGGVTDLEEALRRSLDLGLGQVSETSYNNLASLVQVNEGPRRALDLLREGIEFATSRGLTDASVFMQTGAAEALYQLGEWDESLELATEAAQWGREHRAAQNEALGLQTKAYVLLHQGHPKEVASVAERLLELAREIGDLPVLVSALVLGAAVRMAASDGAGAVSLVREMAKITDDNLEQRGFHLPYATRVLISAGEVELGMTLVPDESSVHSTWARHGVVTARALLSEAGGNLEEALGLYRGTAKRWAEFGFVLEEAQAQLGAGRCLLALGRQEESSARLHEARQIFARLEARPLIDEVDIYLQKATALSS